MFTPFSFTGGLPLLCSQLIDPRRNRAKAIKEYIPIIGYMHSFSDEDIVLTERP